MKKSVLILFLFSCLQFSFSQEFKKIEYLTAFSKVYGYVKYFHPSDEAFQLDWNKFAIYGVGEIYKCTTKQELINTLNRLFNPFAPSVKFAFTKKVPEYNFKSITPKDLINYHLTYWQHKGVGYGMNNTGGIYKSIRVNRQNENENNQLFEYKPEFKNVIITEITDGIFCNVPMVLYCNEKGTYPFVDSILIKKLKKEMKLVNTDSIGLFLCLGNVIITFNVFQHFYPYFDVINVNWERELKKSMLRCFSDKTIKDHLITLEKLTAPLKDGHIMIFNSRIMNYIPRFEWEWIENQLIITNFLDSAIRLKVGDVVEQINGIDSHNYFKEINSRISASTIGWLNYRANLYSLYGDKNSIITLKINGVSYAVERTKYLYRPINTKPTQNYPYSKISDSIYYLNFELIKMDTVNKILPKLEKSKAIICDLRGYPNDNIYFIRHLLKSDDTTKTWMFIPKIFYPDQKNQMGYDSYNWMSLMKANKPYLGDKIIVFIIDGRAISAAESFMGYIEGYKLAIIIGQPTAGTNGNINRFALPGNYQITWTGMKVLKHNGSQHHGIGIIPDIYINKTIKGIIEGKDEFLEKAIEIAKKNIINK